MGHLEYRFTILHDSGDQIISEPIGWRDIKVTLDRDSEYYGLIELFEVPLIFYGVADAVDGGKDRIEYLIDTFGLDCQIGLKIEVNPYAEGFELLFLGGIDTETKKTIDDRKLQCTIRPDDFWAKFKNRRDTPVNIFSNETLDGDALTPIDNIEINLPSQKIRYSYQGYLDRNFVTFPQSAPADAFVQIDFDKEVISEIKETYHYPISVNEELPFPKFLINLNGDYTFDCLISICEFVFGTDENSLPAASSNSQLDNFNVFIQINSDSPIAFTATDVAIPDVFITSNPFIIDGVTQTVSKHSSGTITEYSFNNTLSLSKDDTVRIYIQKIGDPLINGLWFLGRNGDGRYSRDGILARDLDGYHDASLGVFPTSLPPGQAFWQGATWEIATAGTIYGQFIPKGWHIAHNGSSPSQDPADWTLFELGQWENKFTLGDTYLTVTANTTYPDTSCEAVLIHDVAALITERITSQTESFYSEYLGSQNTITRQYEADGCAWNHALTRGLQLRQYSLTEKPFSISFKQWWECINPIINLCLFPDLINNIEVIRIEDKGYAFNSTPIIYFDFINNIEESVDKDHIVKRVKIGYKKWQSEDISGLDDPQTNHDYATVFKTIGKDITIQSDAIAASLAIEQARRTTKEKSADYKYDNETFIIALSPTPTGNTYTPELAENFDSVSNLLNYETRYNLTLTPLRNLLRWGNLLNGCLQKNTTSSYKFTGGEGNYDMVSDYSVSGDAVCFNKITDSISEKQDISLTGVAYGAGIGYLFQPILLQFTHPLSYSDYKLIRDNRTRAIGVSTSDSNHEICFIKKLEYDINISKATFTVWKK